MVNITDDLPYFSGKTSTDKINSKEISKDDINKRITGILNLEHNNIHDFRKDIPPFEERPKYYGGKDSTYEVFNVLEAWELDKDFYLGNVIKYLSRSGKKTINKKQDLQKALVYLQRRIDTL